MVCTMSNFSEIFCHGYGAHHGTVTHGDGANHVWDTGLSIGLTRHIHSPVSSTRDNIDAPRAMRHGTSAAQNTSNA